ncbi:MAG TPA: hypothetical protein VHT29_07480 [Solirubrobacteraceae bacterium]|jgi:DNA-directed RNA polymerase specialized sigma24 family protein|nr:hypothetical protein [Solirubrobacteraceae bacterium]
MATKLNTNEMSADEEIIRLLATIVRQNTGNQTEAILELEKSGFKPTRIGELLGTTADTAKTAVKRARKPKPKSTRKPHR